jgi:hypothetical protein
MARIPWVSSLALLVTSAAWLVLATLTETPRVGEGGPTARIIAPPPDFKLREGRTTPVRVRVETKGQPIREWTLRLLGPQGTEVDLASGGRPVFGLQVAEVAGDDLIVGETYTLALDAEDVAGASASARLSFLVPDLQYTLIPLEPGNFSRNFLDGLSVDASGNLISFGGSPTTGSNVEIFFLKSATAALTRVELPLASHESHKLSRDGRRFFFNGVTTISYYDLEAQRIVVGPVTGALYFTTDYSGQVIALQSEQDLDPSVGNPGRSLQYFLYDERAGTVRQLTSDPQAIIYSQDDDFCVTMRGTTPLLSASGNTVIFVSSATLGLAPPDPTVGCRVFSYDAPTATLRHVAALPVGVRVNVATLSADAHWLSLNSIRVLPGPGRRSVADLLNLRTGEFTTPSEMLTHAQVFDAPVSADGSVLVLSTPADLDPRVGNADGNFDLFLYELATGRVAQISDTTGAIFRGRCPGYRPRLSWDARVVLFTMNRFSGDGCTIDRPQRNAYDGLALGRVRAVRKRPGNRRPRFEAPGVVRIQAGDNLNLKLSATDPDGDPIVFFAQAAGDIDVPPGSQIEDHHNGTATFRWPTKREHAGLHRLRVAAFDEGGGEVVQDVTLAVCSRIVAGTDATLW